MRKFAFIIPPHVELLDLAGPVQVFTEAKFYDFEIALEFYTYEENPVSTAGLGFGELTNYKTAKISKVILFLYQEWIWIMLKAFHLEQKENFLNG